MTPVDDCAIKNIAIYYARGVDALGNEKDAARALEYLRRGFAEDCSFEYFWPSGESFANVTGLDGFVNFAQGFMRDKNYRNTLHCVSNFLIHELDGGRARMESYVVARHFKRDNSHDVATAWYEDEIVRVDGAWKCCVRKCVQISFDNFAPAYSLG